jgi:hypothetical protein
VGVLHASLLSGIECGGQVRLQIEQAHASELLYLPGVPAVEVVLLTRVADSLEKQATRLLCLMAVAREAAYT